MMMEFHVYILCIVLLKIPILPSNDLDAGYKENNLVSLLEKRFYIWLALGHHNGTAYIQIQNHRITESQNSRGWKGPLWVI